MPLLQEHILGQGRFSLTIDR